MRNLVDHYLTNPWATIGGSVVLLFRPPLMDILPMYILFLCSHLLPFGALNDGDGRRSFFSAFPPGLSHRRISGTCW